RQAFNELLARFVVEMRLGLAVSFQLGFRWHDTEGLNELEKLRRPKWASGFNDRLQTNGHQEGLRGECFFDDGASRWRIRLGDALEHQIGDVHIFRLLELESGLAGLLKQGVVGKLAKRRGKRVEHALFFDRLK